MSDWDGRKVVKPTVNFYAYDLRNLSEMPKRTTVYLPSEAKLEDLEYSPAGDSIAWSLIISQKDFLSVWLHKLFPKIDEKETLLASLWVSRLDGTEMHEVGSVQISPDEVWTQIPLYVQWLPDGKRLSFFYRKSLWTVPID